MQLKYSKEKKPEPIRIAYALGLAGSPYADCTAALIMADLPEWWGAGDDDGKVGHAHRPLTAVHPKADQPHDGGAVATRCGSDYGSSLTTVSPSALPPARQGRLHRHRPPAAPPPRPRPHPGIHRPAQLPGGALPAGRQPGPRVPQLGRRIVHESSQ